VKLFSPINSSEHIILLQNKSTNCSS